jgi:hypothetical protein
MVVVNPTREKLAKVELDLTCVRPRRDHLRSRSSCSDVLGARGDAGGNSDARQTTISLDAEATDRAVSFAYVEEPAIAAHRHVDGEPSRARRSRDRIEQCETGI